MKRPHSKISFTVESGKISVSNSARTCVKCVLPETFPEIHFDQHGVCPYCNSAEPAPYHDKAKLTDQLQAILAASAPDRAYDCLALYSGGKDSSMSLIELQEGYGLRVLAFTLDNGFISETTTVNMRNLLDRLGVDHITYRPAKPFMKRIYSLSLSEPFDTETIKYSTSCCGSCISLVLSAAMQSAKEKRIPLLAGGWTPGQFTNSAYLPGQFLAHVADRHFGPLQLQSPDLTGALQQYHCRQDAQLPGLFNPLYCTRYSEQQTIEALMARGWVPPKDTDSCSTNCRLNGYLIVHHLFTYGYHPYVYEIAHHVRLGYMSRDEALTKMAEINVDVSQLKTIAVEVGAQGLITLDV